MKTIFKSFLILIVSSYAVFSQTMPTGNRGLYFDGIDDYVSLTEKSDLDFAGNETYSVELWVKVANLDTAYNIVSKEASVAGQLQISIHTDSSGYIYYATDNFNGGGWNIHKTSTPVIIPNKWTHLAIVSTAGAKQIFVNGVLQTTTVKDGNIVNAYLNATSSPKAWNFGKKFWGITLNGQIDEIRIFNKALSVNSVKTDMASTTTNGDLVYLNLEDDAQALVQTQAENLGSLGKNIVGQLASSPATPLWTLRVTNTNDNINQGSLRWAVTEANTDTDLDYIDFSIQQDGTLSVIKPATELVITTPVILDGYSAYGSSVNTNPLDKGLNTKLKLGLDISSFSSEITDITAVQFIKADNSIVKGFSFFGLPDNNKGHQSLSFNNGKNNRVSGCWFGVKADGTAKSNMNGVYFLGGDGNILGYSGKTPDVSAANIIANCDFQGVNTTGSTNFVAQGNYFGLAPDGKLEAGIGQWGILASGDGGIIRNNVFGNCRDKAIRINANNVTVQGNLLGISADTSTAVGNSVGVYIESGSKNKIGGIIASEANYIANNTIGVQVNSNSSVKNIISGNRIYANKTLGISLTNSGNNGKAVPTITSSFTNVVSGTGNAGDTIQLFSNLPIVAASKVQGRNFAGFAIVKSDKTWSFSPTTKFTVGDSITATATDATNGTSEFSTAKAVMLPPSPKPFVVAGDKQVAISWPIIQDATSYTVLYGTDTSKTLLSKTVTTTSTSITGLTNDQLYYFTLTSNVSSKSPFAVAVPVLESGKALKFSEFQIVNIKNNTLLNPGTGNFTYEMWVKPENTLDRLELFSKIGPSGNWSLFIETGNLRFYSNSTGILNSSIKVPVDVWSHVGLVRNNSNLTMYLNGSTIASFNITANFTNNAEFWIGSNAMSGTFTNLATQGLYLTYRGEMDEFCIWNRALTQSELNNYKDKPRLGNENGLVLLYHFDEPSGTFVTDATANGQDGLKITKNTTPLSSVSSKAMHPFKPDSLKIISGSLTWKSNVAEDVKSYTILKKNNTSWDSVGTTTVSLAKFTLPTTSCTNDYYKVYAIDSAGQKGLVSDSILVLPSTTINNGLVAYFPMDGNPNDMVSNTLGTISGSVLPVKDRKGNSNAAYQFNGTNGFINTNQPLTWDNTKSYSMSFWVKQLSSPAQSQMILGKTVTPTSNGYDYYLAFEKNKIRYVNWQDNGKLSNTDISNKTPKSFLNNWNHITLVYDVTLKKEYLYINGVLSASVDVPVGNITNNKGNLLIGYGTTGSIGAIPEQYFNGILDEMRFYNRSLSSDEITILSESVVDDTVTACNSLGNAFRIDAKTINNTTSKWSNNTTIEDLIISPLKLSDAGNYKVSLNGNCINFTDSIQLVIPIIDTSLSISGILPICRESVVNLKANNPIDSVVWYKITGSTWVRISNKATITVSDTGFFQFRNHQGQCSDLSRIVEVKKCVPSIEFVNTKDTVSFGEVPVSIGTVANIEGEVIYTLNDTTIAKLIGNKLLPLKNGLVTITATIQGTNVKSSKTMRVIVPNFSIVGKKYVYSLSEEKYSVSPVIAGLNYQWVVSDSNTIFENSKNGTDVTLFFKKNASDALLSCYVINPAFENVPMVVSKIINLASKAVVAPPIQCDSVVSNALSCTGNFINGVQINELNNNNSGCGSGGYDDYTDAPFTTSVYLGESYNIKVSIGYNQDFKASTNYVGAWIDYNNNGVFDQGTEFLKSDFSNDTTVELKNIVISSDVSNAGEHRLRIKVRSSGLFTDTNSCVYFNESGETEDYKITLVVPDRLEAPVLLTPNNDGKNDLFIIKGINLKGDVSKLTIMDKQGNVVYNNNNYENNWGGTNESGALLSSDTYYYYYSNGRMSIKGFFEVRY